VREVCVTIVNRLGLHARAAAKFVKLAQSFDARITAEVDGNRVDGKSIMSIMMLAASKGTEITLCADGPDEEAAIAALAELIQARFGEEN
jgi:phosphocarrier protein HPr